MRVGNNSQGISKILMAWREWKSQAGHRKPPQAEQVSWSSYRKQERWRILQK